MYTLISQATCTIICLIYFDYHLFSVNSWRGWSQWSGCSATCGVANRQRTRRCDGGECPGPMVHIQGCNLPGCLRVGDVDTVRDGQDTGLDVGQVTGLDVGQVTGLDVGQDTGLDVGQDTGLDVGQDTGLDVGQDTGLDVGQDTGLDVSQDTGLDVGQLIGGKENTVFGKLSLELQARLFVILLINHFY